MSEAKGQKKRKEEQEQKKETLHLRKLAKEIYQAMLDSGSTVREAELTMQYLTMEVDRIFMERRTSMLIRDLGIKSEVEDKKENALYSKLLKIISGETINYGTGLFDGIRNQITQAIEVEKGEAKLEDLDVTLLEDED